MDLFQKIPQKALDKMDFFSERYPKKQWIKWAFIEKIPQKTLDVIDFQKIPQKITE